MASSVSDAHGGRAAQPGRAPFLALLFLLSLASAAPAVLQARQRPQAPDSGADARGVQVPIGPRVVAGRIVRPTADRNAPVANLWAILHRVGSDTAGPMDSVRTDAAGRYRFRYQPRGQADALYFVSASYGGIAYFTPPLRGDSVVGDAAEITVYDTTTHGVTLHVRGRHLVVSATALDGTRSIVEVFELSNDTSVALVSGPEERSTWTTILPAGARNFQVGQGDVPPDAVTYGDGRAQVFAPFPPGIKQLSFSYTLPADAFPLSVPLAAVTGVLEVLLEDSTGSVSGARLQARPAAEIQGRLFRRWLAQDAPANGVVTITLPPHVEAPRNVVIAVVAALFLVAMAGSLIVVLARRRRVAVAPVSVAPSEPADEASRLAEEIAALDEAHERFASDDAEQRAREHEEYERARVELKTRLAGALAAREGRG